MYFFDFFKSTIRKSNVPIFIYLVLNLFIIGAIIQFLFKISFWQSFLIGIVLYTISIIITLSPIGEWILRLQTGCKKITRIEQIDKIKPLFKEVYGNAKKLNNTISDDIQLYVRNDKDPNAFATGRKTICINEGLLNMPNSQIKAALAHEFGHIANKDTDLILIITVGNLIITTVVTVIHLFISIMKIIVSFISLFAGEDGTAMTNFNSFISFLINIFVVGVMWIWTKIGVLLLMKSRRNNEYMADEFSFKLGYGSELCALLDTICHNNAKGLFANLASSHPDKNDRIANLQNLGSTYRNEYNNI